MMTNDFAVTIAIHHSSWCYLAYTPTSILIGWKTVRHVRLAATAPYRSYCTRLHCLLMGIHWFLMVLGEAGNAVYILHHLGVW